MDAVLVNKRPLLSLLDDVQELAISYIRNGRRDRKERGVDIWNSRLEAMAIEAKDKSIFACYKLSLADVDETSISCEYTHT
jgi:hypothetical protein